MTEELPTAYDVIIVGTGMVESIVAASVARIGKKVLHLDGNSYYGHLWATFNLNALEHWSSGFKEIEENPPLGMKETDDISFSPLQSQKKGISNVSTKWYSHNSFSEEKANTDISPSQDKCNEQDMWNEKKIKDSSRKFNIDLVPKLLFSKGEMVSLLIQSQVSRYTEFISVTNILTNVNSILEPVPCSKSDIFLSKNVTVVNKRILMRILSTCLTYKEGETSLDGFEDRSFKSYLEAQNVPLNLYPYMFAVAMSYENSICLDAVKRAQKFLQSLGCYGNTPFLWPMYGSSELLQAFCRLCAVFGGIYYLGRRVDALTINKQNKCEGVLTGDKLLMSEHVVISAALVTEDFIDEKKKSKISRGIFITDRPLFKGEKEGVTFFQYQPNVHEKHPIMVVELSYTSGACPKGLYILHVSCGLHKSPEDDFKEFIETFIATEESNEKHISQEESSENAPKKPLMLYSLYFEIDDYSDVNLTDKRPENVHVCSGPDLELDFHLSINEAKKIFSAMYPDEMFLQPPPVPNETIPETLSE